MERGQVLEDLDNSSAQLALDADSFRTKSKNLASIFWWQNMKLWFIIFGVAAVVIFVIVWIACGFPTFSNCVAAAPPSPPPPSPISPTPTPWVWENCTTNGWTWIFGIPVDIRGLFCSWKQWLYLDSWMKGNFLWKSTVENRGCGVVGWPLYSNCCLPSSDLDKTLCLLLEMKIYREWFIVGTGSQ